VASEHHYVKEVITVRVPGSKVIRSIVPRLFIEEVKRGTKVPFIYKGVVYIARSRQEACMAYRSYLVDAPTTTRQFFMSRRIFGWQVPSFIEQLMFSRPRFFSPKTLEMEVVTFFGPEFKDSVEEALKQLDRRLEKKEGTFGLTYYRLMGRPRLDQRRRQRFRPQPKSMLS
jgi:hypothetical protein